MKKYRRPWRRKPVKMVERRPEKPVDTRLVTVGGKQLEIKVYKSIPTPENTLSVRPKSMRKFKYDATVGLGGNIPAQFQSAVLDELGPSWFQYGGGGLP